MSEQAQRPSDWKDPLVRKLLFVGGLVVLLLLPIEWIRGLIGERQTRHAAVKTELASTWGGQQTLLGPVLAVPYQEHWKTKDGEPETRSAGRTSYPRACASRARSHPRSAPAVSSS